MKKKMKNIIAVVCAIAMVVSSMTIYSNTTAKAADYSTLEYTKVEVAGLTGTYAYCITNNSMTGFSHLNFYSAFSDLMQMIGSGDSKFAAATVTVNGEDVTKYHTWFDKADAIYGTNVGELADNAYYAYKVVSDGGTLEFVLKKGNPTGSGENPSTETTTSEPKPQTPAQKVNTDDNLVKIASTVKASSEAAAEYAVSKVNDRDVNTRWAAGRVDNQTVAGEWVYVDLEKTYSVTSVVSVWDYLPTDGYQIYYATDLTGDTTTRGTVDTNVWKPATEAVTTATTSADGHEDVLSGVVARYIMIYALSGTPDWGISIKEIGVLGTEAEVPEPVMNVRATGGTKKIDVTWDLPADVKEGTKYYVYLDDSETEFAIVDTNSATLTDVASGQHIVKVKAYYDGVFSTEAVSPQTTVYGEPTAVTQLAVASQKANTVQVQWHYEPNATYKIELVNAAGETVDTITDTTVDGTLGKCEFTDVAKGTYTVKATAIYGEIVMDAVVSNEITVENVQPVNIATLDCDVETVEQIGLTWTVNNETEGQTYKVYLDDKEVTTLPAKTYAYILENVKAGAHAVKVTSVYGEYETEGLTRNIIVKAAPVTKFDTELTQVDVVSGVVKLDDTWSYEFANQSADRFIGISADGA